MDVRLTGLVTGALWLLAACGSSEPLTPGTPLDVAHAPHFRAGLWVENATVDGKAHAPAPYCETDHPMIAARTPDCSQWRTVVTKDHAIVLDEVCAKYGATLRMHIQLAGDFNTHYVRDVSSVIDAPDGPHKSTLHAVYRYVGACPPGMR